MNYTKGECLGSACRFYYEKPDATCSKVGVLPSCSPESKMKRRALDNAAPDMYKACFHSLMQFKVLVVDLKVEWPVIVELEEALAKVEGK